MDSTGAIDLVSGANPREPVLPAALAGRGYARYSDGEYRRLRALIAARHGVPEDCVVLDHGTSGIIEALSGEFGLGPTIVSPASLPLLAHHLHRRAPLGDVALLARTPPDHAVPPSPSPLAAPFAIVCAPSGIDGGTVDDAAVIAIQGLMDSPAVRHGLLVVDGGFQEYSSVARAPAALLAAGAGWLGSFSKAYGIPGYRVGYAILPLHLATRLHHRRGPYAIARLSLAFAAHLYEDGGFLAETIRLAAEAQDELEAMCAAVHRSEAGRVIVDVADSAAAATAFREAGMLVRDLKPFGRHGIAVATHLPAINARILPVLRSLGLE